MSAWETYRDIIDLPYPTRSRHPRMPIGDRAAQFAPFAALTGFGAVLRETERITEKRIELDEYEKEKLDEKIRLILEEKDGGAYVTVSGHIKRVDEAEHLLILEEGDKIPMEDIYEISRV